jgi:hypothetical protein
MINKQEQQQQKELLATRPLQILHFVAQIANESHIMLFVQ